MRFASAVTLVLAACGSDPIHHLGDAACVQQLTDYTVALTTPTAYSCHDPYKAKLALANESCGSLGVTDIKIVGVVTTGQCSPPGPGTFPGSVIAAGKSSTILDFTGGPFCCIAPGCPASFQCDEHYTFTIDTPQGPITKAQDVHLSLDSCNEICPPP